MLKNLKKSKVRLIEELVVVFLIAGTTGYSKSEEIDLEKSYKDINLLKNNNSIDITDNNDFLSDTDLNILNIGGNNLSKLWGIKKYGGKGNVDIKNAKIDISTGDNTISTEVKGVWVKSGAFSANDINLILNNNTNASTWGIEKTDGNFKANDIIMNITAKTGEIYGIFNTGTNNNPSNFEARNIKIVANNENGDFIGITNKWGNSSFKANDISIDATAKGFMVGIENQTINELKNLNDIDIKLNGTGKIIGVDNANSNLMVNNLNLFIANSKNTGTSLGINTGNKAVNINGNLTMKIEGNSHLVRGIDGIATINGNTYLELIGGSQDVYGFRKKATLNGQNNVIRINSSKTTAYLAAFYEDSKFGDNTNTSINMDVKNNDGSIVYAISNYGKIELGKNSVLNINIDGIGTEIANSAPTYQGGIFGILSNSGISDLKESSQTYITVQGAGVNENGYLGTVGIGGSVKADGDVRVDVLSKNGIALRGASRNEKQLYTGNTIINARDSYAIGLVDVESLNGYSTEVKINPNVNKKVQIVGDLKHFTTDKTLASLIDVSLKTEDSFFTGASLGVDNENNKKTNLSLENGASWNVTGKSIITSLDLKNKGQVNFTENKNSVDIKNLKGDKTGSFGINVSSLNKADGNMIYVQESNGGDYQISLQNNNLEDIKIGDKIRFATIGVNAKENNLGFKVDDVKEKGIKNISFEVEKSAYDKNDNQNEVYNGDVVNENKLGNEYVNNIYENGENWYLSRNENKEERVNDIGITIIEAAKSNYANAVFMDNLNKRLGDMSFANDSNGLWVRVRNDRVGEGEQYRLSNYTTQIGYDKLYLVENGTEHRGISFEYSKGDLDYRDLNGNSDTDKYIVTLYKTNLRNNKVYTDLTLRGGALATDFTVYGRQTGAKVVGKFKNMLLGTGGEIGKKFKFNNWYFEPQAQLQYTYINSTDYTTNQKTKVDLDEIHSLIGRTGIRIGKDFYSNNLKNSTIFIKADVNHEFLGKQNVEATDITGSLSETYRNNETWYDLGIGVTKMFTSDFNGFMDIEQQFGSNKDNKSWQANIGFRYKF